MRDLDESEHWYRRAAELADEHDLVSRARYAGQLGGVAYERFLNNAADAYQQALSLFPADATSEVGAISVQLDVIYAESGDLHQALVYYQRAIQSYERLGNSCGAGQARYSVAVAFDRSGRRNDGLLYARAALRNFERVGPGAATLADQTRQLITLYEQGKV